MHTHFADSSDQHTTEFDGFDAINNLCHDTQPLVRLLQSIVGLLSAQMSKNGICGTEDDERCQTDGRNPPDREYKSDDRSNHRRKSERRP